MNEMSDSKEVYDSRPNPFFAIFIYTILSLLVIALVWMYIGEIDIVVKSQGIIRPNEQVSTINNLISGEIMELNIEDGQQVKSGDILYIVDHSQLITDKVGLEEQLSKATNILEMLTKYKKSIEDETNYFIQNEVEEEYYIRFSSFLLNYNNLSHNLSYETKLLSQELVSTSSKLIEMNQESEFISKFKQSISQDKNLFNTGSERYYYNKAEKYLADYKSLIQQYDQRKEEIELSTSEVLLANSIKYIEEDIDGYKKLLDAVKGATIIIDDDIYGKQYLEYEGKLEELTKLYTQANEIYKINKELENYGVSKQEVENSRLSMEKALSSMEDYKLSYALNIEAKITDLEKQLEELKLNKENSNTKEDLLAKNENERQTSITKYVLETKIQLDNQQEQLRQNIVNLEATYDRLNLDKDKNYTLPGNEDEEEKIAASIANYKLTELKNTIDNINAYEESKQKLENSLEKLNKDIDNAVVKAQIDGVVNLNTELAKGDILMSGTSVLTIIPNDDTQFKVSIYVSNNNIAKLETGMKVKYNIYALPTSEYGEVAGTITKISKDIKVNQNNQAGYYLIEGTVENKTLYDYKGNEAYLKVGMSCEAQVITERKKILFYLLEKIDLWD
jgi:HlyD family secretion protein